MTKTVIQTRIQMYEKIGIHLYDKTCITMYDKNMLTKLKKTRIQTHEKKSHTNV